MSKVDLESSIASEDATISQLITKLSNGDKKECSSRETELLSRFLQQDLHTKQRREHWYCKRAPTLLREVATYSQVWLVASQGESQLVINWKKAHKRILGSCIDCVKGMEDALLGSQFTYLAMYKREKIARYIQFYTEWNATRILDYLQAVDPRATLEALPQAVFYHILYNPSLLAHPKIWSLVQKSFPAQAVMGWPEPAPAGLIPLLFLSGSPKRFSASQLQKTRLPSKEELGPQDSHYHRTYTSILSALANSSGDTLTLTESALFYSMFDGISSVSLWSGIAGVIQRFPGMERAKIELSDPSIKDAWKRATFTGVTISHLSRHDQVFPLVINTFETMLRLWGGDVWVGQPTELPQIALDSIKDNNSFTSIEAYKTGSSSSLLGWIEPFLQSILPLNTFPEVLRRIFQIFTEELQHERFASCRPIYLAYFFSALTSIHSQDVKKGRDQKRVIAEAATIHMDFIIAAVFSKTFRAAEWKRARELARTFLCTMLEHEVREVDSILTLLPRIVSGKNSAALQFSSPSTRFWDRIRASLLPDDADGYAMFIRLVSHSAHLVPIHLPQLSIVDGKNVDVSAEVTQLLKRITAGIKGIQTAFEDTILHFVNRNPESVLSKFCSQRVVTPQLVNLLCSPIEDLSSGAQTILGEAYNADGRSDCLRSLLKNHCEPTLKALISQLEKFLDVAQKYLESVSLAQVTVRCYTDVLEVLSSRGSGLLFNEGFKSNNQTSMKALSRLWKLMCKAAGTIIERTPDWAKRYSSNEMIPWMRDALIFANELIAQRRVFESAIVTATDAPTSLLDSPSKLSSDGAQMITDFGSILSPLGSWLRLTNQELLDRSYNLLMDLFDAFKETKMVPQDQDLKVVEDTIRRLSARLEKALKSGDAEAQKNLTTKLSLAQLGTLIRRINELRGEEDSDIEFISQAFSPRKPTKLPVTKPKFKKSNEAFGSLSTSHVSSKPPPPKSLLPSTAKSKGTSVKGTGLVGKMQKVSDSMGRQQLEDDMIQRAIQERKAVRSAISAMNISSSAGEIGSSSSESESDDDTGPSGLSELSKLQRSPIKPRTLDRKSSMFISRPTNGSKVIMLPHPAIHPAPVKRIRFIPDLTPLHRIILSWDYDHDGPEPVTVNGPLILKAVPETFSSHRHYLDVFHPLLVVESWNGLIKSKEERLERVQCTITGKMFADMWVEIDISIEQSVSKGWMLAETDIVLLEHASGQKVLAKVHSTRQTRQGIQGTLRYSSETPKPELERAMGLQSTWTIARVFSLSTVHREYAALMGIGQYDWAEDVFQARINSPVIPSDVAVRKAMIVHHLNPPQAKAVLSSLGTKGFSLIQGPPGTGKTLTICGLIGAFLSGRRQPTTTIQAGKVPQKAIARKALVCAPSNAAIDELAKRLKDGVWNSEGVKVLPRIVRLGADSAINVGVKDISLDNLVEERLSKAKSQPADNDGELVSLRNELARLKKVRQQKQDEMNSSKTTSPRLLQLEQELKELSSQRIQLSSRLTAAQDKNRDASRAVESAKRKTRIEILNEADVICCTLSGAGHDTIEHFEFDLVVIDEAAQAIELSSLIPMKFSFDRCIMVGDPQQLPPTVISQTATRLGYNQSLFVRLQKSLPQRVHLLSIQYRMHPEISRLPSIVFYNGKLEDGPDMASKTAQPWHRNSDLGIYKFFDVQGVEEQADMGYSQFNTAEVKMALSIYSSLGREYSNINFDYRIGIISMYRAQLTKLKEAFIGRYGREILSRIDFNTVDGFQGQEKDIIILSCVRAGPNISSIGFLSDARRVNVAITRSRSSLYILGNAATLKRSDPIWRQIVNDASSRNLIIRSGSGPHTGTTSMTGVIGYPLNLATDSQPSPISTGPKAMTARDWASRTQLNGPPMQSSLDQQSQQPGSVATKEHGRASSTNESLSPAKMDLTIDGEARRDPMSFSNPTLPPHEVSSAPPDASTVPGVPRHRPPPKPKTANLFIPKKPVVKRPLPSDAPYPDPKRKPSGAS